MRTTAAVRRVSSLCLLCNWSYSRRISSHWGWGGDAAAVCSSLQHCRMSASAAAHLWRKKVMYELWSPPSPRHMCRVWSVASAQLISVSPLPWEMIPSISAGHRAGCWPGTSCQCCDLSSCRLCRWPSVITSGYAGKLKIVRRDS